MKPEFISDRAMSFLSASLKKGVEELDRNLTKMSTSQGEDHLFVKQIKGSCEAFGRVLDELICSESPESLIIEQSESIEDAINFISNSMYHRLQSSRVIYETRNYYTQNVGSLSKVYLFYENFIDICEGVIKEYGVTLDKPSLQPKLNVLIDISIHSSVYSQLFMPETCSKRPRDRFIGLTLNEYSFFQIKNTIALLLHEFGHHVNPIHVEKRNLLVFEMVSRFVCDSAIRQLKDFLYSSIEYPSEREDISKVRDDLDLTYLVEIEELLSVTLRQHFDTQVEIEKKSLSPKSNVTEFTMEDFRIFLNDYLGGLAIDLNSDTFSAISEKDETFLVNLLLPEEADLRPGSEDFDQYISRLDDLLKQSGEPTKPQIEITTASQSLKGILEGNLNDKEKGKKLIDGFNNPIQKYLDDSQNINSKAYTKLRQADTLFSKLTSFSRVMIEDYKVSDLSNADVDEEKTNESLDYYISSITKLGLNENTLDNRRLFERLIIQFLKVSLDKTINYGFLEYVVEILEEAFADLFVIETLDLKTYTDYWNVFNDLFTEEHFRRNDRAAFYGERHAIIKLLLGIMPNEVDQSSEFPIFESDLFETEEQSDVEDKFFYFVANPIKNYISEVEKIYPIFDESTDVKKDREFTQTFLKFRELLKKLYNPKSYSFDQELEIIEFPLEPK